MKKIFLTTLLILIIGQLFAQPIQIGLKGGLNESTVDFGQSPSTTSMLTGLHAGVFAEFKFNDVSVEPGLYFTTLGYNSYSSVTGNTPESGPPTHFSASGTVTLRYLQLPVDILYNIRLSGARLFIGGGPYYGYAVSGTTTVETDQDGSRFVLPPSNITFDKGGFDKSDFGVNALAGVSFKNGFLISASYGLGVKNISANGTVKNRSLSFSVGYEFL